MKRETPLRTLLRSVGVRQGELAEQLGVSDSTISRWVSNECPPTVADAARLVAFLRDRGVATSMDELFGKVEAA